MRAREFIRENAGEIVYHGGAKINAISLRKSGYGSIFFVTDDLTYAKSYSSSRGGYINAYRLSPNVKLLDTRHGIPEEIITKIAKIVRGTSTGRIFTGTHRDGTTYDYPETPKNEISFFPATFKQIADGLRKGESHQVERPQLLKIYKRLGYDGIITSEVPWAKNIGIFNTDVLIPIDVKVDKDITLEQFAYGFTQYGKACEVFKNPTPKEFKQCLGTNDDVRAFLIGDDILVWNTLSALHQQVREQMKLPDTALSINLYADRREALVNVSDNTRNTPLWHNPKVVKMILYHPYLTRYFKTIEISYYDEDIYGAWDNLDETEVD